MSKQSNQRYRKELEKRQTTSANNMKNSEMDGYKDSSHTANSTSNNTTTSNLVDRYHE